MGRDCLCLGAITSERGTAMLFTLLPHVRSSVGGTLPFQGHAVVRKEATQECLSGLVSQAQALDFGSGHALGILRSSFPGAPRSRTIHLDQMTVHSESCSLSRPGLIVHLQKVRFIAVSAPNSGWSSPAIQRCQQQIVSFSNSNVSNRKWDHSNSGSAVFHPFHGIQLQLGGSFRERWAPGMIANVTGNAMKEFCTDDVVICAIV